MSNGQPVDAKVHYELRAQPGPIRIGVEGVLHVFENGAAAIVRVVVMGNTIVSETTVAVIDQWEILSTREFVRNGGRLRLGRGFE